MTSPAVSTVSPAFASKYIIIRHGARRRILAKPATFARLVARACQVFGFSGGVELCAYIEYSPDGDGWVLEMELDPSAYGWLENGEVVEWRVVSSAEEGGGGGAVRYLGGSQGDAGPEGEEVAAADALPTHPANPACSRYAADGNTGCLPQRNDQRRRPQYGANGDWDRRDEAIVTPLMIDDWGSGGGCESGAGEGSAGSSMPSVARNAGCDDVFEPGGIEATAPLIRPAWFRPVPNGVGPVRLAENGQSSYADTPVRQNRRLRREGLSDELLVVGGGESGDGLGVGEEMSGKVGKG